MPPMSPDLGSRESFARSLPRYSRSAAGGRIAPVLGKASFPPDSDISTGDRRKAKESIGNHWREGREGWEAPRSRSSRQSLGPLTVRPVQPLSRQHVNGAVRRVQNSHSNSHSLTRIRTHTPPHSHSHSHPHSQHKSKHVDVGSGMPTI